MCYGFLWSVVILQHVAIWLQGSAKYLGTEEMKEMDQAKCICIFVWIPHLRSIPDAKEIAY
jgi:hypothetical protein